MASKLREKLTTQADAGVLANVRDLARSEGRQLGLLYEQLAKAEDIMDRYSQTLDALAK